MTLNVLKFHQWTPIAPTHKLWFIMQNRPGELYMTHMAPFGASGSESSLEEPRDFTVDVWALLKVDPIINWSDDLNIFHFPIAGDGSNESPFTYRYDANQILSLVASLGIPWHPLEKKGQDFSFTTTYTGFNWDIPKLLVSRKETYQVSSLGIRLQIYSSVLGYHCRRMYEDSRYSCSYPFCRSSQALIHSSSLSFHHYLQCAISKWIHLLAPSLTSPSQAWLLDRLLVVFRESSRVEKKRYPTGHWN